MVVHTSYFRNPTSGDEWEGKNPQKILKSASILLLFKILPPPITNILPSIAIFAAFSTRGLHYPPFPIITGLPLQPAQAGAGVLRNKQFFTLHIPHDEHLVLCAMQVIYSTLSGFVCFQPFQRSKITKVDLSGFCLFVCSSTQLAKSYK